MFELELEQAREEVASGVPYEPPRFEEPCLIGGDRFGDLGIYVAQLWEKDLHTWGAVMPWDFPKNASRELEEAFLRRVFGEYECHLQGGMVGEGSGYRFLKQAFFSAAIYNCNFRLPSCAEYWLNLPSTPDLLENPIVLKHALREDVEPTTFFDREDIELMGTAFLKHACWMVQWKIKLRLEKQQGNSPFVEVKKQTVSAGDKDLAASDSASSKTAKAHSAPSTDPHPDSTNPRTWSLTPIYTLPECSSSGPDLPSSANLKAVAAAVAGHKFVPADVKPVPSASTASNQNTHDQVPGKPYDWRAPNTPEVQEKTLASTAAPQPENKTPSFYGAQVDVIPTGHVLPPGVAPSSGIWNFPAVIEGPPGVGPIPLYPQHGGFRAPQTQQPQDGHHNSSYRGTRGNRRGSRGDRGDRSQHMSRGNWRSTGRGSHSSESNNLNSHQHVRPPGDTGQPPGPVPYMSFYNSVDQVQPRNITQPGPSNAPAVEQTRNLPVFGSFQAPQVPPPHMAMPPPRPLGPDDVTPHYIGANREDVLNLVLFYTRNWTVEDTLNFFEQGIGCAPDSANITQKWHGRDISVIIFVKFPNHDIAREALKLDHTTYKGSLVGVEVSKLHYSPEFASTMPGYPSHLPEHPEAWEVDGVWTYHGQPSVYLPQQYLNTTAAHYAQSRGGGGPSRRSFSNYELFAPVQHKLPSIPLKPQEDTSHKKAANKKKKTNRKVAVTPSESDTTPTAANSVAESSMDAKAKAEAEAEAHKEVVVEDTSAQPAKISDSTSQTIPEEAGHEAEPTAVETTESDKDIAAPDGASFEVSTLSKDISPPAELQVSKADKVVLNTTSHATVESAPADDSAAAPFTTPAGNTAPVDKPVPVRIKVSNPVVSTSPATYTAAARRAASTPITAIKQKGSGSAGSSVKPIDVSPAAKQTKQVKERSMAAGPPAVDSNTTHAVAAPKRTTSTSASVIARESIPMQAHDSAIGSELASPAWNSETEVIAPESKTSSNAGTSAKTAIVHSDHAKAEGTGASTTKTETLDAGQAAKAQSSDVSAAAKTKAIDLGPIISKAVATPSVMTKTSAPVDATGGEHHPAPVVKDKELIKAKGPSQTESLSMFGKKQNKSKKKDKAKGSIKKKPDELSQQATSSSKPSDSEVLKQTITEGLGEIDASSAAPHTPLAKVSSKPKKKTVGPTAVPAAKETVLDTSLPVSNPSGNIVNSMIDLFRGRSSSTATVAEDSHPFKSPEKLVATPSSSGKEGFFRSLTSKLMTPRTDESTIQTTRQPPASPTKSRKQ